MGKSPMQYRKKPVVIEAIQYQIHNVVAVVQFLEGQAFEPGLDGIVIKTLEGDMTAAPGDWIIKGVQGEFYPCKPDIFAATYEPVEEAG